METKKLLSVDELLPLLADISRSTLYRLKKEGKVPYHQISNRRIGFDLDEVMAVLRKRRFVPKENRA